MSDDPRGEGPSENMWVRGSPTGGRSGTDDHEQVGFLWELGDRSADARPTEQRGGQVGEAGWCHLCGLHITRRG